MAKTKGISIGIMSALTILAGTAGTSLAAQATPVTIWDIATGVQQSLINDVTANFDASHPTIKATNQFQVNNGNYQLKFQIVTGQHAAPDIFENWGGGWLDFYVKSGQVFDLTSSLNKDPSWKNRFFPSVLKAVTFNGKVYGVPTDEVQPVVFSYNKSIFAKYKLTPPKTWNALLADVRVLKSHQVIPIVLGGKDKWPDLMWIEYLVDRIGGPSVFDNIIKGKPNAWSNPAVIKALQMIQQLVKAGGFEPGLTAVGYTTGEADALQYTGKAAIQLMGNWDFQTVLNDDPSYISSGNYGWFKFPTVAGGKGNPNDIVGNLSNFYSITSDAKNKAAAVTYLKDAILNKYAVQKYIDLGYVPPVKGIQAQIKKNKYSNWMLFNYNITEQAPSFQLSWDQALSPAASTALLPNLESVFLNAITPQKFAATMNKYLKK